MGHFKIQKKDIFIDMTPMSDVMVLLLTFFMLTATFVKPEPVQVNTPGSVSDIKIPETKLMTIFVSPEGKVFLTMDNPAQLKDVLALMGERYGTSFTDEEKKAFSKTSAFGVPMNEMHSFLQLEAGQREAYLSGSEIKGIPVGKMLDDEATVKDDNGEDLLSVTTEPSEFKDWVKCARDVEPNMVIAIKADAKTPYSNIKTVMNSLQDIKENRYNLITNLKNVQPVDA